MNIGNAGIAAGVAVVAGFGAGALLGGTATSKGGGLEGVSTASTRAVLLTSIGVGTTVGAITLGSKLLTSGVTTPLARTAGLAMGIGALFGASLGVGLLASR